MEKKRKSQSTSRTRRSSSSSKIPSYQITDGEWVKSGKFTHHECCDCGLVHKIDFKLIDGELHEQWIRDEKETRKARKRKPRA